MKAIVVSSVVVFLFFSIGTSYGGDFSCKEYVGVYSPGDSVSFAKDANLSSSAEDWGAGYIIAKIPAGTKAKVIRVDEDEYCPGMFSIRILVSIAGKTGWVHPWDIKKI